MLKKLLICLLVVTMLIAGCSAPAPSVGSGDKTVKIALIGPLTGDVAQFGNQMVQGATLAMEQINENGGIKSGVYAGAKYEFVTYDDRADATEATNISQQLTTKEDILGIIGPVNSSNAYAILPILNTAGIPVVSGGASNPGLAQQGWNNFFRAFLNDGMAAPLMADMVKKMGHNKVVVAYANNDFGLGIYEGFKARAIELGMELLSSDAWQPGEDRDFSALITKWKSLNPDIIFIAGEYTETGVIIKQARTAGIEQSIVNEGGFSPDLLDIVGKEGEGVIVQTHFDRFSEDEQTKTFVDRFIKKFNEEPAENASIGYDAFLVIHDAVSRMETEGRKALMESIRETKDLKCINFIVTFADNGELASPGRAPTVIIKDGKYESFKL